MDANEKELRKIRIALIVFIVIFALSSGSREINLENNNADVTMFQHEMVSLEDGHFGILTNDVSWEDTGRLRIYYYDSDANEVTLKKGISLEDLLYE